jgi:hypothetical protein
MNSLKRLILAIFAVIATLSAAAQVDGEVSKQDTIYIIEDEVSYDTLYLYGKGPDLHTKEGLLEAFKQDRGLGRLYYQKGHMYINGADALYQLSNADLEELLPAPEYKDYCKSKRNMYISIPFYLASGASLAMAGIGIYQFGAGFFQSARYSNQLLNSDRLAVDIWKSAMAGLFLCMGGTLAATAFLVPAIVLHVKGKATINTIVDEFNAPATTTAMQLQFGPAPGGVGLTLSF